MAANRPKREKPEQPPVAHNNKKWSLKEKRRLQRALLKYTPHEVEEIAKIIESKKVTEIRAYLDIMEEKLKLYAENRPKEIIEWWTTLASDLISCEAKDYSEVLSNVMSIIANLEDRPLSSQVEHEQPDYAAIYKYIATILTGQDLPFLGKLESAIVLDLMHNLIDTIRTHDTSKQQEIMLQKYQLLNSKIDRNNTMAHVERCRKAINNDFSDFQKAADGGDQDQVTLARSQRPSTSKGPSTSTPAPTKDEKGPTAIIVSPSRKVWGKPTARKVEGAPPPEPDFVKGNKRRGRPKTRDPYERSELPSPEKKVKCEKSPSTDDTTDMETSQSCSEVSENQPGSSKVTENQHEPGTVSENQHGPGNVSENQHEPGTVSENQHEPGTVSENQHGPGNVSENQHGPGPVSENQPGPSCSDTSNKSQSKPCDKDTTDQRNDLPKKKEEIPKKPALFTLNPLCIPIDLLKFKRLVSSDVSFTPKQTKFQMVQRIVPKENKTRMKKDDKKKSESEVELICVDEKKDVIRREKYISIIREEPGN